MRGKNNVTSYTKCSLLKSIVHFNSTLAICLKFVFIEMLDKLITYIVWWYKTVYQVLSDAQLVAIATRSDTDSQNRLDLIRSLVPRHYVCNGYIRVITILPNSEQSYKGKVKTHKYINRQNQLTTGIL